MRDVRQTDEQRKVGVNMAEEIINDSLESGRANLSPIQEKTNFHKAPFTLISNLKKNRYLLQNIVKRNLNQKYGKAKLGYIWTVLEPALLAAVYYVLFIIIADHAEKNYPLWVILGVIGWGLFAKIINQTVNSLTTNSGMINQTNFPLEIYSFSQSITQLIITFLSLLVIIPFIFYLGLSPIKTIWILPLAIFSLFLAAWGIGLLFASLNVIFPDISHVFRFITRAGFFVSPVMWTYEMVIDRVGINSIYFEIIMLNPVVVPITLMRHSIEGTLPDFATYHLVYALIFPFICYIIGSIVFLKMSRGVVTRL